MAFSYYAMTKSEADAMRDRSIRLQCTRCEAWLTDRTEDSLTWMDENATVFPGLAAAWDSGRAAGWSVPPGAVGRHCVECSSCVQHAKPWR